MEGGKKRRVLVLAMHTRSLIHEGTILQRGGGGLDDAKVIKVSKQVNVKSGSYSELFLCQRIMRLIYSHRLPLNINQTLSITRTVSGKNKPMPHIHNKQKKDKLWTVLCMCTILCTL